MALTKHTSTCKGCITNTKTCPKPTDSLPVPRGMCAMTRSLNIGSWSWACSKGSRPSKEPGPVSKPRAARASTASARPLSCCTIRSEASRRTCSRLRLSESLGRNTASEVSWPANVWPQPTRACRACSKF